jgi:hypothetical protein
MTSARTVRLGKVGTAVVAVVGAVVVFAGCGGGATRVDGPPATRAARDDARARAAAWAEEWSADAHSGGATSDGKLAADAAPLPATGPAGEEGESIVEPPGGDDPAGVLTAGSVDDNERWEDYLRYREAFARDGITVHDVDVETREVVRVVDSEDRPVLGAQVTLLDGDTVLAERSTYSDGRALLFPPKSDGQGEPAPYTLTIEYRGTRVEQALDRESREHTVQLPVAVPFPEAVPLDVVFVIDATGSMGDEIERLKANMVSVARQVHELAPRPDVRFGMTVFRDRGDAFVTRTFELTADVDAFVTAMRAVVAGEGGDTPESVNQALHDAIQGQPWRGPDTVKMMFLVGDAAPHLDYPDDADYAHEMDVAAQRGITIDVIASSGLDRQGEYVFRQLAQYTTGRFTFLTYGADGRSPGTSTPHEVEGYDVLSLDELVVKLVEEELAPLRRDQ